MYKTEKENIEAQHQNLFLLEKQIISKKYNLEEIADFLPGIIHLNRIPDVSILYTNSTAQKYFGLTTQEMIESGSKHMVENYHPSTFTDVMPKVSEFGKHGDDSKVFGYSQFIRRDKKTEFDGMLGFAKISKKLNCFVCIENPVSVFGDMTKKMTRLLDDNEFLRKNYKRFASLTKREIEVIKLIGLGESRVNIADFLCISKHTLDNHRKSIRTKLELKSQADLFRYIHAFDLI